MTGSRALWRRALSAVALTAGLVTATLVAAPQPASAHIGHECDGNRSLFFNCSATTVNRRTTIFLYTYSTYLGRVSAEWRGGTHYVLEICDGRSDGQYVRLRMYADSQTLDYVDANGAESGCGAADIWYGWRSFAGLWEGTGVVHGSRPYPRP